MKCKFRRDFTKFFFSRSKMASPQHCSDSAKMCDNLNGCMGVISQLCVLCAKYLQPGGDDVTCDACQRRFHKNCSIGTFKSARSNPNSEGVRDDYVELFGTCEYVDSQNHNWFNNKKIGDLFLIHLNLRSL